MITLRMSGHVGDIGEYLPEREPIMFSRTLGFGEEACRLHDLEKGRFSLDHHFENKGLKTHYNVFVKAIIGRKSRGQRSTHAWLRGHLLGNISPFSLNELS